MAKSDYSRPLDEVTFRCGPCRRTFSGPPERVDDFPSRDWHPFEYVATCPGCGEEAGAAHWWLALLKGWQNATGPRTEAGKAATTANLEGHPTREESMRTRFNAMKHGLSAKTATYFPASPGKYSFCAGCDVDWGYCVTQPACIKQTQLFMQHHAAFEQRNPKHLSGIYADLQAALFAVLQQILQTIIADGVKIEAPQYYTDKEGALIVAEYIDETGNRRVIKDISAHPLFKPLGELLSRNNLSLADMGMTQRVIDDEEQEFGRLQAQEQSREVLADFAQRQAKAIEDLGGLMARAGAARDRDPILIEHQQQSGVTG
jgi:hypothetical protein